MRGPFLYLQQYFRLNYCIVFSGFQSSANEVSGRCTVYANLGPHQYFVSMIGLLTCTILMEYFARMPVNVFRINTQNTTDPAAVFNCSALELFSLPKLAHFFGMFRRVFLTGLR